MYSAIEAVWCSGFCKLASFSECFGTVGAMQYYGRFSLVKHIREPDKHAKSLSGDVGPAKKTRRRQLHPWRLFMCFSSLSESWNHAAESCFVGDAGASTGAHSSRTFRAPRTFRSSSPKPNRVTERSACRMSFALAPLLLRKIRDPCQDQLRTVFITLLALGRIE